MNKSSSSRRARYIKIVITAPKAAWWDIRTLCVYSEVPLGPEYFIEDFEDELSGWTLDGAAPNYSTDIVHSGSRSYMTKLDYEGIIKKFDRPMRKKIASVWFYDDMGTNRRAMIFCDDGSNSAALGIVTSASQSYYVYRNAKTTGFSVSGVPRTIGWHEAKFDYTGDFCQLYIDDIFVADYKLSTFFTQIKIGDVWGDNLGAPSVYFDDVAVYTPETETCIGNRAVTFTDESDKITDIVKNGFPTQDNAGKLNIKASVANLKGGDKELTLIAALYNKDGFVKTATANVGEKALNLCGEAEVELEMDVAENDAISSGELKLFVWDSLSGPRPYGNYIL